MVKTTLSSFQFSYIFFFFSISNQKIYEQITPLFHIELSVDSIDFSSEKNQIKNSENWIKKVISSSKS